MPNDHDVPDVLAAEARNALKDPQPLQALARLLEAHAKDVPIDALARSALALRRAAPTDRTVWSLTDSLLYSQVPSYHWQMVVDHPRNDAYANAIAASVGPGMTVLEIGTGSGLLAMLAARAGADHVYTVESDPIMAEVARACIDRNGFADRVTIIEAHSTKLGIGEQLPVRADVLVHEILTVDVLGEMVLPSVAHAKAELLKPDAILLPQVISAVGALAHPPDLRLNQDMRIKGLDLSPLTIIDGALQKFGHGGCTRLSDPVTLLEIDLARYYPERDRGRFNITATREGTATGIEQWMRIGFPDGTWLITDDPASHWQACFHPFGTSVPVAAGDEVGITAEFDRDRLTFGLADAG